MFDDSAVPVSYLTYRSIKFSISSRDKVCLLIMILWRIVKQFYLYSG